MLRLYNNSKDGNYVVILMLFNIFSAFVRFLIKYHNLCLSSTSYAILTHNLLQNQSISKLLILLIFNISYIFLHNILRI